MGHLYGLLDVTDSKRVFPILDPKWLPLSMRKSKDSNSKFLSYKIDKILREISAISKSASDFIHACDYDQEGEVIGYNILEYACHYKYSVSKRAKFSSLTDEEIIHSFNNLLPANKKLKDAGISRHMIDFIYGINLSRALTNSIRKDPTREKKGYQQLSIGRVQGPTLAFVVDRDIEIEKHVYEPYWNITADFMKNNQIIKTYYYPQRIDLKSTAENIIDACRNQLGKVLDIKIQKVPIKSPVPFNLGELQREAYKLFRFTPSYTLVIAEKLYLAALISYPRTSSQKLPSSINYEKIIKGISRLDNTPHQNSSNSNKTKSILSYSVISSKLLSKKTLKPNEGKETDPAHPAIYPTGQKPKQKLEDSDLKLFDLIIRRFFSTLADDASTIQISVTIAVKEKYIFKAEEKKILSEGWIEYYKPYFDLSAFVTLDTLSFLKRNDILKNVDIKLIEKLTQPPPRYNQSSLLQKMEKEKIGTKATRSEIISTLFKRNYVTNLVPPAYKRVPSSFPTNSVNPISNNPSTFNSQNINKNNSSTYYEIQRPGIRPTEVGIAIIESMRKHVPSIVSTDLTRSMEEQLEEIEMGKSTSNQVIDYARNKLVEAITLFNQNQKEIGQEISNAFTSVSKNYPGLKPATSTILGVCPVCIKGNLLIKKAIKTKKRFVGCSHYSTDKCLATAPLPQKGTIKGIAKKCTSCKWPIVSATGSNQGKKYKWQFCINAQCPSKTDTNKIK